ncbi:unnamed protein product (macronuclear) [Paramecium tetraurelia]|uniref:Transmembrane protein n=1 Tax=Paramecium tetraurelia TaxID=5888 RepID=A0CFN9_PARTE|nr:uncharacterized protein GSPATT00038046001 [Paramecium tetraurelia]CAK69606.1 unnamed protein product [Paramecium tetraurelia]|eukprot:XP_001437003.1 hypothetical protein (macronuclear) [Paramecium tetraurelia strain d4-2]
MTNYFEYICQIHEQIEVIITLILIFFIKFQHYPQFQLYIVEYLINHLFFLSSIRTHSLRRQRNLIKQFISKKLSYSTLYYSFNNLPTKHPQELDPPFRKSQYIITLQYKSFDDFAQNTSKFIELPQRLCVNIIEMVKQFILLLSSSLIRIQKLHYFSNQSQTQSFFNDSARIQFSVDKTINIRV